MPRRLQLVDPEPRLLPEGLIPNPDPRLPPEAEDRVTSPFHEDLVVPHLHGQTKMEEDECVDHSVKADGQTKMEEDEYVKADFSERQLHQLFMFLDAPPGHSDVLEDKKHIKRLAVVCNLCGGVPDYIQEGSSLQDRRAVQEHASLHRDVSDDLPNPWVDQSTNMEPTKPKSCSEAELLRIYVLGSFCVPGYKMHLEEFSLEIADQVWHAVICKLCYGDVYQTQDNPSGCLHKIPMLQEHASRHSEYLCMDGPSAPELDFEDYMKGWLTSDEDGFLSFEDDAPVQKGFVKICRWCKCKGCKSGNLGTVRIQCHTCGDFGAHITYECPLWEREFGRLIPCNGLKKLRTTLMESWKLPELPRAVCKGL